jgi:hypothetical protein
MSDKSAEENLALYKEDCKNFPEVETSYQVDGYKVTITRYETNGTNNGYVHLPKGHRFYEWGYEPLNENCNLKVHGGLTFSGPRDDEWLIGFDTAHLDLGDSLPLRHERAKGRYWTHTDVLTELKSLVFQLNQMDN